MLWNDTEEPKKDKPIKVSDTTIKTITKTKFEKNDVTLTSPFNQETEKENDVYCVKRELSTLERDRVLYTSGRVYNFMTLSIEQLKDLHDILNELFSTTKEQ